MTVSKKDEAKLVRDVIQARQKVIDLRATRDRYAVTYSKKIADASKAQDAAELAFKEAFGYDYPSAPKEDEAS